MNEKVIKVHSAHTYYIVIQLAAKRNSLIVFFYLIDHLVKIVHFLPRQILIICKQCFKRPIDMIDENNETTHLPY